MEFKQVKLKDIAAINMGQSPKGNTYNNLMNGMPFLQGRKTFGRMHPNIDTWTTNPIKIAERNSILMSVRAPVGDINIANKKTCIGRGLCSILMKNGNHEYLYYLLINIKEKFLQKSTGTVFDSINKTDLENIKINIPSDKNQKKIAKILSNIDKKIELNYEINNNLYEIIKELYKNLFAVNNWREITLNDICKITSGKRSLKKNESGKYPIIGANGVMGYTNNYNYNEEVIIIGRVGTLGSVKRYNDNIWLRIIQ